MDNKKYLYLGCFVATLLTTIVGLIIVSERILAEYWLLTPAFVDHHGFVYSAAGLYAGFTFLTFLICRKYAAFPNRVSFRYFKSPLLHMVPLLGVVALFEGVFFLPVPMSDFEKNALSIFIIGLILLYIGARFLVNGQNIDARGRHELYIHDQQSFSAGVTLSMYLLLISLVSIVAQTWSWTVFGLVSVVYMSLFVATLVLGYFKMKFLQIVKP